MPQPICATCNREMSCDATGTSVIYTMSKTKEPYKIVQADRYICKECGTRVISGFGNKSVSTVHDPDFENVLKSTLKRDPHYVDMCHEVL